MQLSALTIKNYWYHNATCSKIICCNLFKNHKKTVKTGLRHRSTDYVKMFSKHANTDSSLLKPQHKLSTHLEICIKVNKICEENIHDEESSHKFFK